MQFVVYKQRLEQEIAELQGVNDELTKDKREALPLLQAYRSAPVLHNAMCLTSTSTFSDMHFS